MLSGPSHVTGSVTKLNTCTASNDAPGAVAAAIPATWVPCRHDPVPGAVHGRPEPKPVACRELPPGHRGCTEALEMPVDEKQASASTLPKSCGWNKSTPVSTTAILCPEPSACPQAWGAWIISSPGVASRR